MSPSGLAGWAWTAKQTPLATAAVASLRSSSIGCFMAANYRLRPKESIKRDLSRENMGEF
jgi:hypothetical protein